MSTLGSNVFDLPHLTEEVKPFRLHHFPEVPSTNDLAIEMRKRGELFAPAIILADRQTAGRGRGTNRWFSAPGGLTISYVIPVESAFKAHQLPLVVGLAVRNAAAELSANTGITLKWPNDVLCGGKKLAGLLCERFSGVDVIGIGLNVNNAELPNELGGVALATIAGNRLDLTRCVILLTQHLRHYLMARESRTFAAFLNEYREHDALPGATVSVSLGETRVSGICEGVDSEGLLLIRAGGEVHRIVAGTVRVCAN